MKLLSFKRQDGSTDWGILCAAKTHIITSKQLLGGQYHSLKHLLASGRLGEITQEARTQSPTLSLNEIEHLPVLPNFGQMLCAGLNYQAHASESGKETPKSPRIFARLNSSLVGHNQPLIRPRASYHYDYEGELAVVIGKLGRHIPEDQAFDHVAGYTVLMDGSIRDWQKITTTLGKNFFATGSLGPYLVTSDELGDPTQLTLTTRLNGQVMQQGNTATLVHTIPRLISYLSEMTPLYPGDVIATGTPEGVGQSRTPPVWLRPGDTIEVDISGIGTLSNSVEDEQ